MALPPTNPHSSPEEPDRTPDSRRAGEPPLYPLRPDEDAWANLTDPWPQRPARPASEQPENSETLELVPPSPWQRPPDEDEPEDDTGWDSYRSEPFEREDEPWLLPADAIEARRESEDIYVDSRQQAFPWPENDLYSFDDAIEEERPAVSPFARRMRRASWELVQTLFLAALIFLAVRAMAQNFRVEGSSMEPGLHDGQYLLVNKAIYFKIDLDRMSRFLPFVSDGGDQPLRFLFRSPKRGDVVVFRYPRDPNRDFIKRVIAVPGDTVKIESGVVTVNGQQLEEPYIDEVPSYDFAEQIVPEGAYFVLGDNRSNSYDSHAWGFVPEENIIGQAIFSYWPLEELGGAGNRKINLGLVQVPLP
jgi:signal peptidase I